MKLKNRLVPGFEAVTTVPGDGRMRTSDTPYGCMTSAICYDMDFPELIRQAGRAKSDVLLVPASDWEAIKQLHRRMAVFRAVENGVSMLRAARWGFSEAVDPLGRTLASMDHFASDRRVMVAQLPTAGMRTIYAYTGELFAWLCMAGLLLQRVWGRYRAYTPQHCLLHFPLLLIIKQKAMPTNLPPEYFEVDKHFREAQTPAEKVALLEELIATVPKHKGTDKLRADLRRQLSKLREEARAPKKHGAHQSSYTIEREGAGQAVLIGATNVGKSALLAALTHAQPEVSQAPYTTWKPVPGMMPVENIQVQLVDTPPMDREYVEPGLFDLVRRTDLILLVVDLQADPLKQLEDTLALLEEHHIASSNVGQQYPAERRMTFIPLVVLANKCDDESLDELFEVCCEMLEGDWPKLPVSAVTGRNFDVLKQMVYERLDIIRVYAKPPGREADLEKPFVLKKGSTIAELGRKIHRDFSEKLKTARVWGSTAFEGQMVQRDYILQDGDIVELRI